MKRPLLVVTVVLLALPAHASAQYPRPDSGKMGMDSSHHGAKGTGRRRMAHAPPRALTRAQIRELQSALAREGCDPGGIDGRMGPQTRRAIACARKAKGIDGNNANELFRALALNFSVVDSMGMGGIMRSARPSGMRGDAPRGMGRGGMLGHDSAMVYDSSRANRDRGRGLKERTRGRDTMPPGRTPR